MSSNQNAVSPSSALPDSNLTSWDDLNIKARAFGPPLRTAIFASIAALIEAMDSYPDNAASPDSFTAISNDNKRRTAIGNARAKCFAQARLLAEQLNKISDPLGLTPEAINAEVERIFDEASSLLGMNKLAWLRKEFRPKYAPYPGGDRVTIRDTDLVTIAALNQEIRDENIKRRQRGMIEVPVIKDMGILASLLQWKLDQESKTRYKQELADENFRNISAISLDLSIILANAGFRENRGTWMEAIYQEASEYLGIKLEDIKGEMRTPRGPFTDSASTSPIDPSILLLPDKTGIRR